jgi:2-aminoadipate transaminase
VGAPDGAGGKVSDGAVFAKSAIDKGVAFVPGAPFYARIPITRRCG